MHQITNCCCPNQRSNTNIGAVRTVSGSESIIYKDVTDGSQILAEGFTVLGLLSTITGVLQKDHISVLHCFHGSSCIRAYHLVVGCELDLLAKKLGETYCNRC